MSYKCQKSYPHVTCKMSGIPCIRIPCVKTVRGLPKNACQRYQKNSYFQKNSKTWGVHAFQVVLSFFGLKSAPPGAHIPSFSPQVYIFLTFWNFRHRLVRLYVIQYIQKNKTSRKRSSGPNFKENTWRPCHHSPLAVPIQQWPAKAKHDESCNPVTRWNKHKGLYIKVYEMQITTQKDQKLGIKKGLPLPHFGCETGHPNTFGINNTTNDPEIHQMC